MASIRDHIKDAMHDEGTRPPYEKEDVQYSKGNAKEYCGICTHFEVMHEYACELVKGHIESHMWCKLFERE